MNEYDVRDFQRAIDQLKGEFKQGLNQVAGGLRKYSDESLAKMAGRVEELSRVTHSMSALRTGRAEHIWQRGSTLIEDIPGRRVPYVMVVDILIAANDMSTRSGSITISQEGPFVAVRRMATFQSALSYQVTEIDGSGNPTGNVGRFQGRSFGRYRPIHSVCDVMDSQHNAWTDASRWWLAALANPGAPVGQILPGAALGVPSNMSSFRSMEFDGRISVINAGSSYPRQNVSLPSSFWAEECNTPVALGALDFFERGEVLTVNVQPNHVNNPPAGNVDGAAVFPAHVAPLGSGWPFLEGQYDAHEGIVTSKPTQVGQITPDQLLPSIIQSDNVTRLPDGILTIAWEGYRIIQPVGVPG